MPSASMEQVHGVDVSWMTHGSAKDKGAKTRSRRSTVSSEKAPEIENIVPQTLQEATIQAAEANGHPLTAVKTAPPTSTPSTQPKAVPQRPALGKHTSSDKNGASTSPGRKSSWFSHISKKLSATEQQNAAQAAPPPQILGTTALDDGEPPVPKIVPVKNAVLQHAPKYQGDGPYTPCPPKSSQPGLFHVFRRLSSSGPGQLSPGAVKKNNHGLVERRTLNIDQNRERCGLKHLDQARLRRVAFCPDIEIAPMPNYADPEAVSRPISAVGDKDQKRKVVEKGEGAALKNPKAVEDEKEVDGDVNGEKLPKEPQSEGTDDKHLAEPIPDGRDSIDSVSEKPTDVKKKEKKKKSEEERKARKEKKRQLAEANGQVPLELHLDSDSSVPSNPPRRMRTTAPTNPCRIYRRCCQLRESPSLKKVTEQLMSSSNVGLNGVVDKLDLSGYSLQLTDLTTIGDFLAVTPIREIVLENCGLTDEGLRVVLAGLLACKRSGNKRTRRPGALRGLVEQGGVVERLILKNNKIGPEGWKYLSLFIYMCRTLKQLDLSEIQFPRPIVHSNNNATNDKDDSSALSPSSCSLFAQALRSRLAGSTLELLNIGDTGMTMAQLGRVVDGALKCGIRRLGVAHLDLDAEGLQHIGRYLSSGKCEGLDLGGNDLQDHCSGLVNSLTEESPLWALSLADCNLQPAFLGKLLPQLAKLPNFRFIDLSHNHDLFKMEPNALSVLRKYLPKIETLKRLHLSDCGLKTDHVIALAEIIPEIPSIAHVNFLENPELTKLADAKTDAHREEAAALYASLLAAARVSDSIVALDIDVPTEESGEIVRALAKQIVAYCLRNMERLPLTAAIGDLMGTSSGSKTPHYPDVIQHLVGHDTMTPDEAEFSETAPDDDYLVGGTGIAKALAACLKNSGDDNRRQSGEFSRDGDSGIAIPSATISPNKAREVSKHLLAGARKIRARLYPALDKARTAADDSTQDKHTYYRLAFLLDTLDGIIKRFEDEYPETRQSPHEDSLSLSPTAARLLDKTPGQTPLPGSNPVDGDAEAEPVFSDAEDDPDLHLGSLKRTASRTQANEEARIFRTGHKFRSGFTTTQHDRLVLGAEEIINDPNHSRVLVDLLEDLDNKDLLAKYQEKGGMRLVREDMGEVIQAMKKSDPEYWAVFIESQEKARENTRADGEGDGAGLAMKSKQADAGGDEQAIADD